MVLLVDGGCHCFLLVPGVALVVHGCFQWFSGFSRVFGGSLSFSIGFLVSWMDGSQMSCIFENDRRNSGGTLRQKEKKEKKDKKEKEGKKEKKENLKSL